MANLKLPKELNPGFSTKVKPTVPVVIDWNNPLARGLKAAFIFQDGSYTSTWDHVNKRFATTTNATNQGVNAGRESIYFNDAASQKIDLSYIGDFSATETVSVYSRLNYQDNTHDHCLLDINTQNLLFWADQEPGPDLRPGIYAATPRYATTGALNGPGWLSWGGSADRSGGVSTFGKAYVNGVLDPLGVSDNVGATDWTTSSNISLTNIWTTNGKESEAFFEYIYVWDRVLSEAEFKSINDDPYQIFKPAIDITYFYQAAAATTKLLKLPKEWYPGFSKYNVPNGPVVIDWDNSITRGLQGAWLVTSPAFCKDFVKSNDLNISSGVTQSPTARGMALDYSGATTDHLASSGSDISSWLPDYPVTLTVHAEATDGETGVVAIITDFSASNQFIAIEKNAASSYAGFTRSTGTTNKFSTPTRTKEDNIVTYRANSQASQWMFIDGAKSSEYTTSVNPFPTNLDVVSTGGLARSSNYNSAWNYSGKLHFICVHNRALSDAEIKSLHENPYQIFKPAIDITYFTSTGAGGGDTNVAATTTTLAITEYTATIAHDINVSTNLDTLIITEQSATVAHDINVSTNLDTLIITEQAATIAHDINVSTNLDTLIITEYAATVDAGGDTNIAAGVDTLIITEQAATIAHDINVSTNLDTLIITEQSATVAHDINVSTNLDTLIITEQAATVTHDINVSTNLDTLVITEQPATITGLATNVTASVVNLTLAELSCTVQLIAANDFNFTTGVASAITNTKGASSAITSTKGIKGLIQ